MPSPDQPRRHKGRYVEIPDATWNALGERAALCGRSRVAEVRLALEWWLAQPPAATPPKKRKR